MSVLKYACLCCDSDCSLFFASYSEWQNVEAIKYNKNKMSRDSPHSLSLSLSYIKHNTATHSRMSSHFDVFITRLSTDGARFRQCNCMIFHFLWSFMCVLFLLRLHGVLSLSSSSWLPVHFTIVESNEILSGVTDAPVLLPHIHTTLQALMPFVVIVFSLICVTHTHTNAITGGKLHSFACVTAATAAAAAAADTITTAA